MSLQSIIRLVEKKLDTFCQVGESLIIVNTNKMAENKCNMCGHNNPKDNFRCEAEDCGVPLDLEITINDWGLPEIN